MNRHTDNSSEQTDEDTVDQRIRQLLIEAEDVRLPSEIDTLVFAKIGNRRNVWRAAAAVLAATIVVAVGVLFRKHDTREARPALIALSNSADSASQQAGRADTLDSINLAPLAAGPPVVDFELVDSHQDALLQFLKALEVEEP